MSLFKLFGGKRIDNYFILTLNNMLHNLKWKLTDYLQCSNRFTPIVVAVQHSIMDVPGI